MIEGLDGAAGRSACAWVALPGHEFLPDSISPLDPLLCETSRLATARQVTDSYLLALAKHNGRTLATFDPRLVTDAVIGGAEHVHLLGESIRD